MNIVFMSIDVVDAAAEMSGPQSEIRNEREET
jgi:hypothetical protein